MTKHKFKNPKVNNQYKKPACHTDHCFQRHACCNNYRCCVCHCCLDDYKIYSEALDRCVGNLTQSRNERGRATPTTGFLPTKKKPKERTTEANVVNRKPTKTERTTKVTWQRTPKRPLRRNTQKVATEKASTYPRELTTIWQTMKPTVKDSRSRGGNVGYQSAIRDDKTSTIAGVAVALALVAIVAVVVLVVMCSRRKKRNRNKAVKTNTSNNDAAVVTIPLTIENVSDKSRDTEEGTTSDTTIDSPIAPSTKPNGTPENYPMVNGNTLVPQHGVGGPKRHGKKHRRSRHSKENGTNEQKRLYKEHHHHPNGTNDHQLSICDEVAHNRAGQCLNKHVCMGAPDARIQNGLHLQHRNGSLECDV